MFLHSDCVWEYRIELAAMELPCIRLTFRPRVFCRDASGFVIESECSALWCLVPSNTCLLRLCRSHFWQIYFKDLLCKFCRMIFFFHLSAKPIYDSIYWYVYIYYYLNILFCFIYIFTYRIAFNSTWILVLPFSIVATIMLPDLNDTLRRLNAIQSGTRRFKKDMGLLPDT